MDATAVPPIPAPAPAAIPPNIPTSDLRHQLVLIWRVTLEMKHRALLLTLAGAVAAVILLAAFGQVRLNAWQGSFYDALSRKDVADFVRQLGVFLAIISGLVVLGVAQTWLQETIKLRLRASLTEDLLDQWLLPKRAYRLALLGDIGVNPDQRLQEDARHLTELTGDLGIGLFQSSILLVSFVTVLWVLSERVALRIHGYAIPGYMVWCALIYALVGSALVFRVGRPLIALNAQHYAREAELRFSMVRVSESAEGIALYGGEMAERGILEKTLDGVLDVMRRLIWSTAGLTWVTSFYGYGAIVVPFIVASPGYFSGTLSFGDLMMVVGAFMQVQQALRWFVDNFARIADWQATFSRVMAFYEALIEIGEAAETGRRLRITVDEDGKFGWRNLGVIAMDGTSMLEEGEVELIPGEHVEIVGDVRCGKTTLFHVLAGLWPLGTGELRLPPGDTIMFMPQRRYIPQGTLRGAVTYPSAPDTVDDKIVRHALERVGLGGLEPSLDEVKRWDHELKPEEQQSLAFARLLIQKPVWVVMDSVPELLKKEHQGRLLTVLARDLPTTTVINISSTSHPFFTRTLHLRRMPGSEQARPVKPAPKRRRAKQAA